MALVSRLSWLQKMNICLQIVFVFRQLLCFPLFYRRKKKVCGWTLISLDREAEIFPWRLKAPQIFSWEVSAFLGGFCFCNSLITSQLPLLLLTATTQSQSTGITKLLWNACCLLKTPNCHLSFKIVAPAQHRAVCFTDACRAHSYVLHWRSTSTGKSLSSSFP